jgi:hypothetical protein
MSNQPYSKCETGRSQSRVCGPSLAFFAFWTGGRSSLRVQFYFELFALILRSTHSVSALRAIDFWQDFEYDYRVLGASQDGNQRWFYIIVQVATPPADH